MISFADPLRSVNRNPSGVVLYSGPSELDGAPIVAIATFYEGNPKTGPMIQSRIMRAISPLCKR